MSWEIFQIGKHVEVLGREHTWRGCGSSKPPTFPIPCLICISLFWLSLYNKPVVVVVQSLSHVRLFWDSVDCSTPGFPVLHHLQEIAQTHVRWVSDGIQPSHLLLSPSLPAFNPSQHQSLFWWVSPSYQVAKVLLFQLQHQSFQWLFRIDFL